jgi:hypothetical protein
MTLQLPQVFPAQIVLIVEHTSSSHDLHNVRHRHRRIDGLQKCQEAVAPASNWRTIGTKLTQSGNTFVWCEPTTFAHEPDLIIFTQSKTLAESVTSLSAKPAKHGGMS